MQARADSASWLGAATQSQAADQAAWMPQYQQSQGVWPEAVRTPGLPSPSSSSTAPPAGNGPLMMGVPVVAYAVQVPAEAASWAAAASQHSYGADHAPWMARCQEGQGICPIPEQLEAAWAVGLTSSSGTSAAPSAGVVAVRPHMGATQQFIERGGIGGQQLVRRKTKSSDEVRLAGPCFCKIIVPNYAAGAIMGRQGCAIAQIELQTRCHLQISADDSFFPGTTERIIILSGTMESLRDCLRAVLQRLHDSEGSKCRPMMLKLVVPSSAVSPLIGHGGSMAQQLSSSTQCRINISPRVGSLKERLVSLSGTHDSLAAAAIQICEIVQDDPHLEEHLCLRYTEELPLGAWAGNKAEPADVAVPLMSPASAQLYTKRAIIEYLKSAAPRDVLVKHGLLGSIKNTVKSKNTQELVEVVSETWLARGGDLAQCPVRPAGGDASTPVAAPSRTAPGASTTGELVPATRRPDLARASGDGGRPEPPPALQSAGRVEARASGLDADSMMFEAEAPDADVAPRPPRRGADCDLGLPRCGADLRDSRPMHSTPWADVSIGAPSELGTEHPSQSWTFTWSPLSSPTESVVGDDPDAGGDASPAAAVAEPAEADPSRPLDDLPFLATVQDSLLELSSDILAWASEVLSSLAGPRRAG